MDKREKVIKGLTACVDDMCEYCPYYDEEVPACDYFGRCNSKDMYREALELLKEQEAVKPCVAVDTWICSKCGHTLESQFLIDDKENPQVLVHEQYNFCPGCGRAVKWDAAD